MRQKVLLQPTVLLNSVSPQPGTDIVRCGNNKSGVVFFEAYNFAGSTTMGIQTTADDQNTQQSAGSLNVWVTLGTVTITAAGVQSLAITNLGEAIRWNVQATTGSATVKIIAFLSDQAQP